MIIEGTNILLYIEKNGEFIITACDKNATLDITSDFLDITDPDGSRNKRRLPTLTDWSLTGNGLVDYNRLITAAYMQQTLLTATRIKINWFASVGSEYVLYEGFGYFETVSEVAPVNDATTFSYTILADGDLLITDTFSKESEDGKLYRTLMNNNNDLITDSNNNLIIV